MLLKQNFEIHFLSFKIIKMLKQQETTHLLRRKSKATVNFRTGPFDNIDSVMITLLMIAEESMLSKRPVLRFSAALLFLLQLLSSHIYCILNTFFVSTVKLPIEIPSRLVAKIN